MYQHILSRRLHTWKWSE